MASLNRVELIGNIGKDPEFKILQGGAAYLRFSLATSEKWKDKTTLDEKEETEWHRCILWGKQAETANRFFEKGKQVYLSGKLKTRKYEDKDGKTCYSTEVVVREFLLLGRKGDGGSRYEPNPEEYGKDAQGGYGDFNVGELGPPLDADFDDQTPLSPGG